MQRGNQKCGTQFLGMTQVARICYQGTDLPWSQRASLGACPESSQQFVRPRLPDFPERPHPPNATLITMQHFVSLHFITHCEHHNHVQFFGQLSLEILIVVLILPLNKFSKTDTKQESEIGLLLKRLNNYITILNLAA